MEDKASRDLLINAVILFGTAIGLMCGLSMPDDVKRWWMPLPTFVAAALYTWAYARCRLSTDNSRQD